MNNWFEVDKAGLAKILARKGLESAVFELIQNAWDEDGVTTVKVSLESIGHGRARLRVEDDAPAGFSDLSHAFTLFAESKKKANPEKRGRFNLGEKLVLAICSEAKIVTTSGLVLDDGRVCAWGVAVAGIFSMEVKIEPNEFDGFVVTLP
jgi:DNA topoisomerase VI subunit B